METLSLGLVGTGSALDSYPPHGGWQRQIWGVGQVAGRRGHRVTIYARRFERNLPVPPGVTFAPIGNPSGASILSNVLFSLGVANRLRDETPDFLVYWGERFAYLFLRHVYAPKGFVVDWDALPTAAPWQVAEKPIRHLFLPVKYAVEDGVRRSCDVLYAMNRYIKNQLEEEGFTDIWMLPLGVDPSAYFHEPAEGYLLYVGRLHPSKGIDTLLRAFAVVGTEFPELRLVIVGDGTDASRLRALAIQLRVASRTNFVGRVRDFATLTRLYARCTAFVLPSYFEGLGIALLEAMASGKPTLASDIPGPQDVIESGRNGLLFRPRHVDSLAKALTTLLRDEELQAQLGRRGRKYVERFRSYEKTTDALLEALTAQGAE